MDRVAMQPIGAVREARTTHVKPYMTGFARRGEVREPAWAAELTAEYW
jgi:hypothetical protein